MSLFLRCCLCSLLLIASGAQATTRLALGLDELVRSSSLIFRGSVVDTVTSDEAGVVYTRVVFAVDDVVKGDPALESLTLRFLGGISNAAQTDVEGQFIPARGAEGLWFVDDASRALVNPLAGWSQGYFPIVQKADGTRWLDLREHPDYAILAPAPALAGKMQAFRFPQQQVDAQFPRVVDYLLTDFIAVIHAIESGVYE